MAVVTKQKVYLPTLFLKETLPETQNFFFRPKHVSHYSVDNKGTMYIYFDMQVFVKNIFQKKNLKKTLTREISVIFNAQRQAKVYDLEFEISKQMFAHCATDIYNNTMWQSRPFKNWHKPCIFSKISFPRRYRN